MGVKLQGADIERHGPVGLVKIHPVERMMERSLEPDCDEFIEVHTAIAQVPGRAALRRQRCGS